ncbi:MAG: hypothetical protein M3Y87_14510 [Myxococcota bacterium]|nr:hypothetical protein [Myxococcota bacterium]
MDISEIVSWLGLAFRVVVSLGVIGVALAVVRPQLPRTGWLLAAAAGVDALATCCSRALWRSTSELDYDVAEGAYIALGALDVFVVFVLGALVIATIAVMAQEGRRVAARS